MFDFSWGEIFVVTAVAVIALGPKQLPVIAEHLGRWVKQGRRFVTRFENEWSELKKHQQLADNEQRAQTADAQYEKKSSHD